MWKWLARTYREAYAGLPPMAWILALVEFINRSGTMVLFFLVLYMVHHLGFSTTAAGTAMSAYGLGSMVGAYGGGRLCDRLGANRVQWWSLFLGGLGFFALSFVTGYGLMCAALFVQGALADALHPANGVAMTRACPPEILPRGFALNRLAVNLGVTIGPVAGGFLAVYDYRYLFWVDGFTSLAAAATLAGFLRRDPPAPPSRESASSRSPWRDRPFLALMGLTLMIGLIFSQILSTFPLYLNRVYGLRENGIGWVIAVNTVFLLIFEMVVTHRLSGVKPTRILALGSLFFGAGFVLMPLGTGFAFAALTVLVWTIGEMVCMPTLTTVVVRQAGENDQGKYMGAFSLSFTLAAIVGPTAGTSVYSAWGGDAVWYAVGVLSVLISVGFSLWPARESAAGADAVSPA